MPCATQPAVTRASPILFGCRMHAGQVHCDERHHDGDLLAGQVALDYANSLTLLDITLVVYLATEKSNDILRCAL